MKMDTLSAAYDSDASSGAEGEETPQQEDEATPINVEESSSVLSRLKEKFPLNSAPAVPIRVSIRRALIGIETYASFFSVGKSGRPVASRSGHEGGRVQPDGRAALCT